MSDETAGSRRPRPAGDAPADDPRYEPESVDASADDGVVIAWSDGHVSRFALEEIRLECRCAHCNGARDQNVPVWRPAAGAPALDVVDATLMGAYGISFHWSDGHQTGIYRWMDLREMCGCLACREEREAAGRPR